METGTISDTSRNHKFIITSQVASDAAGRLSNTFIRMVGFKGKLIKEQNSDFRNLFRGLFNLCKNYKT